VIPEDHYGVSRLLEVVIYAVEGISRQRNECRWLIVASQRIFCDGFEKGCRLHDRADSLLQASHEDCIGVPRISRVFICIMESIQQQRSQ
jgi:hypothetical protein